MSPRRRKIKLEKWARRHPGKYERMQNEMMQSFLKEAYKRYSKYADNVYSGSDFILSEAEGLKMRNAFGAIKVLI